MPDRRAWLAVSSIAAANTAVFLASSQGSLSVLYRYLVSEFGYSRATVGSIGSLILFVGGVSGLLAGVAVDRFGIRRTVLAGTLAVAGGCVATASAGGLVFFYAFAVCMAVAQAGSGFAPAQVLATRRFRQRRGMAMGIATVGLNVGGVLGPVLTSTLAAAASWRIAYAAYALSALALLPVLWLSLREPDGPRPQRAPTPGSLLPILRSRGFWLPTLAFAAMLYAVVAVAQHWVLMQTGRGMAAREAALLLTVYYAVGIAGRFIFGPIYDRYPPARVGMWQGMVMTGLILLLLIPDSRVVPVIYAVLFGLCYGGFLFLSSLILGRRFEASAQLGTVIGAMASISALLYSTAPAVAGWLYDLTGSDAAPVGLAAGMAALASVLIAASGNGEGKGA